MARHTQDDAREKAQAHFFGLRRDVPEAVDVDALIDVPGQPGPTGVQLKSVHSPTASKWSATTSRDLTLDRVRNLYTDSWFILTPWTKGRSRTLILRESLILGPGLLEPWVRRQESRGIGWQDACIQALASTLEKHPAVEAAIFDETLRIMRSRLGRGAPGITRAEAAAHLAQALHRGTTTNQQGISKSDLLAAIDLAQRTGRVAHVHQHGPDDAKQRHGGRALLEGLIAGTVQPNYGVGSTLRPRPALRAPR